MINRRNYQYVEEYLQIEFQHWQQSGPRGAAKTGSVYRSHLKTLLRWLDEIPVAQTHTHPTTYTDHLATLNRAYATNKKSAQVARQFLQWYLESYPGECKRWPKRWLKTFQPPEHRFCVPPPQRAVPEYANMLRLAELRFDEASLNLWMPQVCAIMLYLSGMRVGALAQLPIQAVNLPRREIRQWPELGVLFKNWQHAKQDKPTTFLWNIPELLHPVQRWHDYISAKLPPTAMWLPPPQGNWGHRELVAELPGLSRNGGLARMLRTFATKTELPYFNPHAYRHGHIQYGLKQCATIADFQALSENVMHADMFITPRHYSSLSLADRRTRLIS